MTAIAHSVYTINRAVEKIGGKKLSKADKERLTNDWALCDNPRGKTVINNVLIEWTDNFTTTFRVRLASAN